MADRQQVARERFSELWLDWGQASVAGELVPPRVDAVVRWLDRGQKEPQIALRATQVLLLDPEFPGAGKKGALRKALSELGPAWAGASATDLFLLQAMILAARPEAGEGGFGLVGLMGAGWEVMVGRGGQREELLRWRFRLNPGEATTSLERSLDLREGTPSTVGTLDETPRFKLMGSLRALRTKMFEGESYPVFGSYMSDVLRAIHRQVRSTNEGDLSIIERLDGAIQYLNELDGRRMRNISFDSYGPHLVGWLDIVTDLFFDQGESLVGLEPYFGKLRSNASSAWRSDQVAPLFIPVVDAIVAAIERQYERQKVTTILLDHSTEVRACIGEINTQLPLTLAAARPAELELLWWGQSRYCHTFNVPYRRLLKDPTRQNDAFYAATGEAASRAYDLDPEPAAAFLVETLATLGLDVDERRTLGEWLRELAARPVNPPGAVLAELAGADATGLPVTWARLHAGKPWSEDLALAIALPLDAAIDRGQWATWILRERVLDLRLGA